MYKSMYQVPIAGLFPCSIEDDPYPKNRRQSNHIRAIMPSAGGVRTITSFVGMLRYELR
jgi:hypothetical protein